ncbi:putative YccA/Bax inhibitor family protein [Streptomyces sp. SAI-135]|nr:putative YccA/Bax inhibitor family protein [Streptomyces sp. SAI-090]MDH6621577.1 putative YccA/Bax inhibitor family protein [Streptomyces sp. SAI-135]
MGSTGVRGEEVAALAAISVDYCTRLEQGRVRASTPAGTSVTMDDVVVRTATTLGTVALTDLPSWLPLPVDEANLSRSYGIAVGAALVAFGVVGVLLGAAFPALDFKQVEDAVAYGAPREGAWLSAFGLTLTLVCIYLEVLRVLTILNSDN